MRPPATPAAVLTVSDRAAAGIAIDRSGPLIVEELRAAGLDCPEAEVVPDGADSVEQALRAAIERGARVVITTGGTGIGPRDATPEGTAAVITRHLPGLVEEIRRVAVRETPAGVLSRGLAGIADSVRPGALVVNLPGSTGAVLSGLPVIVPVIHHVISQLDGGDH